jgi:hypothetical protein
MVQSHRSARVDGEFGQEAYSRYEAEIARGLATGSNF